MPKVRIVIQSRLSSSRLPAKALLPVAGMPSVALCALRAANTGIEVVVATSTDPGDDLIAEAVCKAGVSCFRGPLDDVLGRYELATRDLEPGSVVVRMTADNLLPDGEFAAEMIDSLLNKGLVYLQASDPALPYGLAAEVFTVDLLREACAKATEPYDREHVTPWIREKFARDLFKPKLLNRNLGHLRCTMDTFEDYLRVVNIFRDIPNPVRIPWFDLANKLASLPGEPEDQFPAKIKNGRRQSEMTLGTAQLGMEYGVANRTGKPTIDKANDLIRSATKLGINLIDTARAYGEAESRIGEALTGNYADKARIVTKLDPLANLSIDQSRYDIYNAVDASVFRSCRELHRPKLPVLLLHRWEHRRAYQGAIWERLLELRNEGVIETLGASLQSPEEAWEALADPDVGQIQLPFNILDWRWKKAGIDQILIRRKDIVVHARSIFLQGLLIAEPQVWPNINGVNPEEIINAVEKAVGRLGRENRADLCIAYVRAQPWIDSLVIGMETIEQLQGNVRYFKNNPLTAEETAILERELPIVPEQLLNPALWNLK